MDPFSMLHSQGDGIWSWCLAVYPHHTCILTLDASKSNVLVLLWCCPRSRLVLWLCLCVLSNSTVPLFPPLCLLWPLCVLPLLSGCVDIEGWRKDVCLFVCLSVGVSISRSTEEWVVGVMGLGNRVKETALTGYPVCQGGEESWNYLAYIIIKRMRRCCHFRFHKSLLLCAKNQLIMSWYLLEYRELYCFSWLEFIFLH